MGKAQRGAHALSNTKLMEDYSDLPFIYQEYNPARIEQKWYDIWIKNKYFHADISKVKENPDAKKFVMMLPPPNVTGTLHLGHALLLAIEDTIVRWKRMRGYETLYLPGIDHAGISTQNVVENKLWKESKTTRHELGREKFLNEVWKWKDEYSPKILNQLKKFGASLDWERYAFTLDEPRSIAVTEAFVRLYDQGLIYRNERLVNWCCALNTALSDLEVEYEDIQEPIRLKVPNHKRNTYEFGYLTEFAYKLKDSDEQIIVATTRLETMLGDVAVAVHPDDNRYKHLIGKSLVHPFISERDVKIIADADLVDMNFGTGAVKVTPAHDPNDFICGQKHNLELINILNDNGSINSQGGEFEGMMRLDARIAVEQRLKALGLLGEKHKHSMRIGKCAKTGDIIEPLIKPQWYLNCKTMAERAINVVKNGDIKILPKAYERVWCEWLENIQDWWLSRQLWWGHRIPAFKIDVPGDHWVVTRTLEEAKEVAIKKYNTDRVIQDEDVLDTWFSSSLFPFYTLGWPDESHDDYKHFFPGDLLETGHDILFFWVARMVMMSLSLTDKIPFKEVYLHPIVRDQDGRKMSKSLGNVIDPLQVINGWSLVDLQKAILNSSLSEKEITKGWKDKEKRFPNGIPPLGSDALRFSLLSYMIQPRSINIDVNVIISYRLFNNKLWNASKFIVQQTSDGNPISLKFDNSKLTLTDKWILVKLDECIKNCNQALQSYEFGRYAQSFQFMNDLCDTYIEVSKIQISENLSSECRTVLLYSLDTILKLIAPALPYITEEIYQHLNILPEQKFESLCIAEYPQEIKLEDINKDIVCQDMEFILLIAQQVRSALGLLSIGRNIQVDIYLASDSQSKLCKEQAYVLQSLTGTRIHFWKPEMATLNIACIYSQTHNWLISLDLKDIIDIPMEIRKIDTHHIEKLKAYKESLLEKLCSESFISKAPESVVADLRYKLENTESQLATLSMSVDGLRNLLKSNSA